MNISDKAKDIAKSITLTSDDVKRFEPRGSFAMQCKDSRGEIMCMVDTDIKHVTGRNGELEFTVLKFAELENATKRANCTIAYDFQNIFLSTDTKTSLHKIGMGNQGVDAIPLMAKFVVDKIEPQGIYPMKYSRAAQELNFLIGREYSDSDWTLLRAKYKDDAMKVVRTDNSDDISWLEIQHVYITPKE